MESGAKDGMTGILDDFHHLYQHALQQPPSYREVTELAGHGAKSCDSRAGRAAWLLMNIRQARIYGVHSLVHHKVSGKYAAPILNQVGTALGIKSALSDQWLQENGATNSLLDVLAVKDGTIWLVQAMLSKDVLNSVVGGRKQRSLFQEQVFCNPVLKGKSVPALYAAFDIMRLAFPSIQIRTMALVLHPTLPDFELFDVPITSDRPDKFILSPEHAVARSSEFADRLAEDHDALLTLPDQLDNNLFKGLPPCRGGRTLGLLAAMARLQLNDDHILIWKERQFIDILKMEFEYEVPRDKVRHDLIDRLVLQGFLRKWESGYHLMMKGIARYLYSLAKYTSLGTDDPMNVIEQCRRHRDKVISGTGCP
jgi:hypothetical protein